MTKFGYQVLTLKLQCCQEQLSWFPMVTISAAMHRDKRRRPVLVCCFVRLAAYNIKGRQVATGNGASCL